VYLPLLEAHLDILVWYGCETCCHNLLNFRYRHTAMTLHPSLMSWEEPKDARSEILRMGGILFVYNRNRHAAQEV